MRGYFQTAPAFDAFVLSVQSTKGGCCGPAASYAAPDPWAAPRTVCSVVPLAGRQPEGHPGLLVAIGVPSQCGE